MEMYYGVTESRIARRINTEKTHKETIRKAYENVLKELSSKKEWMEISLNQLEAQGILKSGTDRETLLYQLKENSHIITKPAITMDNKPSLTKPVLFKWVEPEDKITLGFDGLAYKMITPEILSKIKNNFKDLNGNSENSILCLCDYLLKEGACTSWVPLEPLKISLKTGMPIETAIKVIDKFVEKNIIIVTEYLVGNKQRVAVRLILNNESKEEAIREIQKNEIFIDTTSRRDKKKKSEKALLVQIEKINSNIENNFEKSIDVDEEKTVDSAISSGLFEIEDNDSIKALDKIDSFVKLLVCHVHDFKDKVCEVLNEQSTVDKEYFKTVEKLLSENEELKHNVESLRKENNSLISREKKRKELDNVYNSKLVKEMNILTVTLSVLFEDFSKKSRGTKNSQEVLDEARSDVINAIAKTREALMNVEVR